jgi:hypothetical protein
VGGPKRGSHGDVGIGGESRQLRTAQIVTLGHTAPDIGRRVLEQRVQHVGRQGAVARHGGDPAVAIVRVDGEHVRDERPGQPPLAQQATVGIAVVREVCRLVHPGQVGVVPGRRRADFRRGVMQQRLRHRVTRGLVQQPERVQRGGPHAGFGMPGG